MITPTLEYYLQSVFSINNVTQGSVTEDYNHMFVCERVNGKYFIPCAFIKEALYHNNASMITGTVVCPLYKSSLSPQSLKTVPTIIKNIFPRCYRGYAIVDTTKGYKYLMNQGLVMDSNYVPIMVCGYEVEITNRGFRYNHPVCYIRPSVYSNSDILSKYIAKNMIQYYSNKILPSTCDRNGNTVKSSRIRVIVSDEIDRFVRVVQEPLGIDENDLLYRICRDSINDIQKI